MTPSVCHMNVEQQNTVVDGGDALVPAVGVAMDDDDDGCSAGAVKGPSHRSSTASPHRQKQRKTKKRSRQWVKEVGKVR